MPGLVPTQAQRNGDFSQAVDQHGKPVQLYNPMTGQPYLGNQVPISSQAQALLNLYPLPNFAGNSQYNYQLPLIHELRIWIRSIREWIRPLGARTNSVARLPYQAHAATIPICWVFLDATNGLGIASTVNWSHTFSAHLRMNLGYQFSRQSNRVTPYWANPDEYLGRGWYQWAITKSRRTGDHRR